MKIKLFVVCLYGTLGLLLPAITFSQFTHKIKADSVRIYNDNCTAELIVENSTSNIKGFLFNKGLGRTEFRKAVIKLNDSSFLIGGDTLTIKPVFNGLLPGSVLFYDGTEINQDNDNFFWDNTNKRLGIGTNTPQFRLDMPGYSTTVPQIRVASMEFQSYTLNNTWFGNNAYYDGGGFRYRNNGGAGLFYFLGSEGQFRFMPNGVAGTYWSSATNGVDHNGSTQMKITADGIVALGGSMTYHPGVFTSAGMIVKPQSVLIGTTTDDGTNRLQVNGYSVASGYRVPSGTTTQFLKADGSVDNNTYLTASSLTDYLPLTGGTLTGSLNGTSANFNNSVTAASFSGVGTGLTGYANGLSIGGTSTALRYIGIGGTTDLNSVSDALYRNYASDYYTNKPSGSGAYGLVRSQIDENMGYQHFYDIRHGNTDYGDLWIRTKNTSGFSGWSKMLHNNNYNLYAPSLTGDGASGTWPISITGNANYASSAGSVAWSNVSGRPTALSQFTNDLPNYGNWQPLENQRLSTSNSPSFASVNLGTGYLGWSNNQWNWSTLAHQSTPNSIQLFDQYSNLGGSGNPTGYGTILDIYGKSAHMHSQWYMGESGQLLYRNAFYGSDNWNAWQTLITSSNYSSYSPTLTGGGASGTWPISITGNANYASSAGSVAWSNVSGRPTALSQFTNDLPNYGNWQPLENQRLSTSNDVSFGNIYSNGWLRNNNANEGIYNQALASHFYASNNAYWNIAGSNGSYGGLILRDNHNGPLKGYYYWDASGSGLLSNAGNWSVRLNYGANAGGQLYGPWTGTISNAQRADRANGNFYVDDNYGNSIIGVYSSTRYQGIYAMGSAYKLPDDGSHSGSLYGLAWTHDNVGGQAKSGLGHQMLVMENGVTQTAIGNGIWTRANIVTTNYGSAAQWNDKATHRSEGTNYIDYSRYVYNNGAYSGSGWVEPSDLGVRYANSAGSATHASYLGGHYYDSYIGKFGSSYYQTNTWQQFNGSFGLYWPSPGISAYGGAPHFYPNSSSPYGSFTIVGSRNGYSGLHLNDASGTVVGMYDGAGNGGDYDVSTGWHFYWNRSNNSLGIGGSTTASGYKMYVNGSSYVDGNIVTTSYGSAASWNDKTIWYSQSHNGTYYLVNNWDGTYWNITSNHGNGVKVAYASSAESATSATNATNSTYGRYVYNNGVYSGSGWVEASDLGVRYANSAGSATSATNATNSTYGRYVYNNGAYSGSGWVEASDLGVRYANSAGSASYATTAGSVSSVDWSAITNKPAIIDKVNTPASYSVIPTIKGEATGSTENIGVMGIGSYGSNYNVGVHGDASYAGTSGIGTYGRSYGAASSNYGIYGTAGGGYYNYAGYFDGVVYSSSYFTTSDLRVKKNIVNEESILTKVKQLRPVSFDYDKGSKSLNLPVEKQHGFIAQELQAIFPESVKLIKNPVFEGAKLKGHEEILGINYQSLIPILVKALQEQDGLIEELKKRIEALEKKKL